MKHLLLLFVLMVCPSHGQGFNHVSTAACNVLNTHKTETLLHPFISRPVNIWARRALGNGCIWAHGSRLPFNPGQWLIKDQNHGVSVMSNTDFVAICDAIEGKPDAAGYSLYREKPIFVWARRIQNTKPIRDRGVRLHASVGDWLVKVDEHRLFVISHDEFTARFEALAAEN